MADVFDEEKDPSRQIHQQCKDEQRHKTIDKLSFVKTGIADCSPIQEDLRQNHVQKNANVAHQIGSRIPQEREPGCSLWRSEVAKDEHSLHDVIDESDHQ